MSEVRVSLAFLQRVHRIADGVRGIDWKHLAHDHPVESMRSAASHCLTVGRKLLCSWRSAKAATCTTPGRERPRTSAPPSVSEAGIAVEEGSERLRENTTKIIPFETAEPQANMVDTGPEASQNTCCKLLKTESQISGLCPISKGVVLETDRAKSYHPDAHGQSPRSLRQFVNS